jgi:hypothetical protein
VILDLEIVDSVPAEWLYRQLQNFAKSRNRKSSIENESIPATSSPSIDIGHHSITLSNKSLNRKSKIAHHPRPFA